MQNIYILNICKMVKFEKTFIHFDAVKVSNLLKQVLKNMVFYYIYSLLICTTIIKQIVCNLV